MRQVAALAAVFAAGRGVAVLRKRRGLRRPPAALKPKLVVLLSVDQMRGDYIDKFRHQWTKGLHRLVTEGAWFRQADYPYYTTVTCAGHASISTGTVPAVHGMVANTWWDRNNSRIVSCTDDETVKLIPYGIAGDGVGHSAKNLMSTDARRRDAHAGLAGAARRQHFAEGALGDQSVGHRPDVVIWLDERDGGWVTSTAFAKAPAPYLADYIAKHPMSEEIGRTWDRSMPKEQYLYEYSRENRRRTPLATKEFPHIVKGTRRRSRRRVHRRVGVEPVLRRLSGGAGDGARSTR